ncbi:GNAT family N-acetyltransferase [Tengunoibacter tsumagoiensis]|nr:GNAT family N-acetyltransferase [Tengunoibacter tsumagoiensis]
MRSASEGYDELKLRPATKDDRDAIFHVRKLFEGPEMTPETLGNHLQSLDLEKQTRVVESSEGTLIGYAELWQRRPGWFTPQIWVHPLSQRRGLGMKLLQALEVCAFSFSDETPCTLLAQPSGAGRAADHLLEKRGYFLQSTYEVRELTMRTAPAPIGSVPGIQIRSFVPAQDAQKAFEADNEAFLDQKGYISRTFELWSQRLKLHADDFDPTLCFLAWDEEHVAGGVYNHIERGVGEVMHLGVRRPFRKRGVGTALMRYSLAEYYQRGITTVHLTVDADSLTQAHLLYERLGFQVKDTYRNYIYELSKREQRAQ